MYMALKNHCLRFLDALHFFLELPHNLNSTYNIDTKQNSFPHASTDPKIKTVGEIPDEDMYGAKNMGADTYNQQGKPWCDEIKSEPNWDFKHEMTTYYKADVELLKKSVLNLRQMFKGKLDIDPFRYVTLASLCMAIFRSCFLPDKSIKQSSQNNIEDLRGMEDIHE